MVKLLRSIAASIRDDLDRRMHGHRRGRALERLAVIEPERVLFVCLGNICRSPYAERAMNHRGSLASNSAGFIGPGRSPPPEALAEAASRGVEHGDHVSTIVTRDALETADAVFVFDRNNLKRLKAMEGYRRDRTFWLGDFDPVWSGKRAIIDPWGRGPDSFRSTFDRIDRCVETIVGTATRAG